MNSTRPESKPSPEPEFSCPYALARLFDGRSEARGALQGRLEQFSEYAVWLQGLTGGVLRAVERDIYKKSRIPNPGKKVTFAP
jgi:hypothetical protein